MPSIRLRNISNDYILRNINLDVENSELFVLLGPTGSGKTTLLKVIAGLIRYRGNVFFDNKPVDHIPPEERGVGYLPQNLVLFPHLDVASNVGYSLKVRGKSRNEAEQVVDEFLAMMGISHLKHRYPRDLSGGERQRVALARVLASNPKIFLFDEPLNNLDLRTKNHLKLELKKIQKKLGITTIYVTHDIDEAEEMSDKVGILYKGEMLQISNMNDVIFSPRNEKIFSLIGIVNILDCSNYNILGGVAEAECSGVKLIVPYDGYPIRKIAINSRDIFVSVEKIPGPSINLYKGEIVESQSKGSIVNVKVRIGEGFFLISEIPEEVYRSQGLKVGDKVYIKIKLKAIKTAS